MIEQITGQIFGNTNSDSNAIDQSQHPIYQPNINVADTDDMANAFGYQLHGPALFGFGGGGSGIFQTPGDGGNGLLSGLFEQPGG